MEPEEKNVTWQKLWLCLPVLFLEVFEFITFYKIFLKM